MIKIEQTFKIIIDDKEIILDKEKALELYNALKGYLGINEKEIIYINKTPEKIIDNTLPFYHPKNEWYCTTIKYK